MKRLSFAILAMTLLLPAGNSAVAQSPNSLPGGSKFNPPLPPPPPPPKIEVPVVPQMDVPSRPNDQASPRASFHQRVSRCLDEAAASGLGPGDRDFYVRACANR